MKLILASYTHYLLEVLYAPSHNISREKQVGMETAKPEIETAYLQMRAKTDKVDRFAGK